MGTTNAFSSSTEPNGTRRDGSVQEPTDTMAVRRTPVMPMRDHFRPPLDDIASWEELHGAWPTVIVMTLNPKLPPRYVAAPRVHLGAYMEIDVSGYDKDETASYAPATGEGGVALATWAPPRPTFDVVTDLPDQDEYE